MLHATVSRDHGVGVQIATILLDAGARLDVRDELLKSTPLSLGHGVAIAEKWSVFSAKTAGRGTAQTPAPPAGRSILEGGRVADVAP